MVSIDGEFIFIVEIMAELEGSLYYYEILFFSGSPVYFTVTEDSSGVEDWVFLPIVAYLVNGSSNTVI